MMGFVMSGKKGGSLSQKPPFTISTWPNVKYLKTSEISKVSSNFDIYSFVKTSRDLVFFLQVEKCAIFWEISHLHQ